MIQHLFSIDEEEDKVATEQRNKEGQVYTLSSIDIYTSTIFFCTVVDTVIRYHPEILLKYLLSIQFALCSKVQLFELQK